MKPQLSPAIVLRHVDFRESDRVVTVFTREQGRIAGLARGVRKSVKRFAGRLDLFSEVNLEYRVGRGDLFNFENADLTSAHLGIRNDLYRIAWAGYLCELTEKLFGEAEPHPDAYDVLSFSLHYLSGKALAEEGPLRALELQLLSEAGMQPELTSCGICRATVESERSFAFVVARGSVVCENCIPIDPDEQIPAATIGLLGGALVLPLARIPSLHFTMRESIGARVLMNAFVRYHVGLPLRTATFLAGLEPVAGFAQTMVGR